jgi:metal-sulfur cluster biosynthetic enzyme
LEHSTTADRSACGGVSDAMITEAAIREALNEIVDPCSRAAGAPAGLVEMGMIPTVTLADMGEGQMEVGVKLIVTHPFCMMSSIFINEIDQKLSAMAGVGKVNVEFDASDFWTPDLMSDDYRQRLAANRARRRENTLKQRQAA